MLLAMGLLMGAGFGRAAGAPSFAVVGHRSNPINNLRVTDLRAFFGGVVKQWPHGAKVVLVERDAESAPFRFLLRRILTMSAGEYKRSLASIEFRGEAPVTLKVLNSDAAACKFVFNVPGSIAVIETDSLHAPECGQVQILKIEGKAPGEEGYRLR